MLCRLQYNTNLKAIFLLELQTSAICIEHMTQKAAAIISVILITKSDKFLSCSSSSCRVLFSLG